MNLDGLSLSLGMLLIPAILVLLFYFIAYLKNVGRYALPKYLPREDEIYWARLNANSTRIWALNSLSGMKCIDWDFGLFAIKVADTAKYQTFPMLDDVIVVPKKWGGNHALVIASVYLTDARYEVTAVYLGEYINGQINSTRKNTHRQSVQIS